MSGVLGALARALLAPSPQGGAALATLSPALLRDVLPDGSSVPGDRSRPDARRPISFQTHPSSELVEFRDRSALASLPRIGDRGGVA